jgi:AraC family transcriptional regulator, transcriptional activator of pobA
MKRNSKIETYAFKPGFPHEIELGPLKSSLETAKSMVARPHRTEFYHVLWFQRGKAVHLVDFKPIPVQAGSLLFLGKGRVLMFDTSADHDGIALRFTDAFFCRNPEDARFLQDAALLDPFNESPLVTLKDKAENHAGHFGTLFGLLESEIAGPKDAHQHQLLQSLVRNVLASADRLLIRKPQAPKPAGDDREYGRKFTALVDRDFRASKRIAQYADKIGITEKRLQKAVNRIYGKPPKEIVDNRIILEAKRLLLYGNSSIKEITAELGFDEPTNFIKYFRKHMSQTPARVRERYLG